MSDVKLYYNKKDNNYFTFGYDDYGVESPRECGDYKSTFITFESRYSSPDKNEFREWDDMLKHFGVKFNEYGKRDMYDDLEQMQANALKKGIVLMPVWKYEHGGVSYCAADRCPYPDLGFDSGVCGVIYEKRDRRSIEKLQEQLKSEVEEYSNWLNEPVYEIAVYDKDGELVENICGIYRDEYSQSDEDLIASVAGDYFGYDFVAEDLETVGYEEVIDLIDGDYEEDWDENIEQKLEDGIAAWVELDIETRIQYHQGDMYSRNQEDISYDEEER